MADVASRAGFDAGLESLDWSDRLFVAYPLWLGKPPPLLRQLFDAHACLANTEERPVHTGTARVMVTASLPALLYRASQDEFSVPGLAGLETARTTIVGSVDTISGNRRERWLTDAWRLGAQRI